MRIVSLASGSAGNAYCVESGGEWLLIDCGLGPRDFASRCKAAAVDPSRIAAAVFTHDHCDHCKGLARFHAAFPNVPLCANYMTADAIAHATGVGDFLVFENGQEFRPGPFAITAFSVPHDTPDCVGFTVRAEGLVYFHATDTGTPLASIGARLAEADWATLESNYDPQMLCASARPESLKSRIRGGRGHLSNDEAAELTAAYASPRLRGLALAHLSRECNAPHLALAEMRRALAAAGKGDVRVEVFPQDRPVELAPGKAQGEDAA